MSILLDTHFHFDFIEGTQARLKLLEVLGQRQIGLVAQTVKPSEFLQVLAWLNQRSDLSHKPLLSLGFHPWWIESWDQAEEEIQMFKEALTRTPYIGEIGLDFVPKRLDQANRDLQVHVFRQIIETCCQLEKQQALVLSIHAVRSEDQVLSILEEMEIGKYKLIPILHRFNGNHQELLRLLELGGYLSIHPQLLRTKKGRAYLKQVPLDRLLLETDLPEVPVRGLDQAMLVVDQVEASLNDNLDRLSDLRSESSLSAILANQRRLYVY